MILPGKPISPGVAKGHAHVLGAGPLLGEALKTEARGSPDRELERFRAALGRVTVQLDRLKRQLHGRIPERDRAIFDTHAVMLHDVQLVTQVEDRIVRETLSAGAAVSQVVNEIHAAFATSAVSFVQDKAADILDIGRRLVQCLSGSLPDDNVTEGAVIVATALTPSELVRFAHLGAVAVVLESCGPRSHTAILARGLGIPTIADVRGACQILPHHGDLIVDATRGRVVLGPSPEQLREFQPLLDAGAGWTTDSGVAVSPVTTDGERITLLLNIGDPSEVTAAAALAPDGIGLVRSEFLYMDRERWPTSTEVYETYHHIATAIGDGELAIRLTDFGAEKCPPYADIVAGRNPSLGLRGLRLLLHRHDILRPQVEAAARLAQERPLTVLLPMLDTLDTLEAATRQICSIAGKRRREDLPFRLGTMIETPSAALMVEEIADRVDALSIGLNDLTQYVLAADRDDELIEPYHDALQPAVLRQIRAVVRAGDSRGVPVTMCGELAGDPAFAGLFLALGVRRLSVSRICFADVARAISGVSLLEMGRLADAVLACASGRAVRELLANKFGTDVRVATQADDGSGRAFASGTYPAVEEAFSWPSIQRGAAL